MIDGHVPRMQGFHRQHGASPSSLSYKRYMDGAAGS